MKARPWTQTGLVAALRLLCTAQTAALLYLLQARGQREGTSARGSADGGPVAASPGGAAPRPPPDLDGFETENCVRLSPSVEPAPGGPPLRRCRPRCSAELVETEQLECATCALSAVAPRLADTGPRAELACAQHFGVGWTHWCDHPADRWGAYEVWCRPRAPR